MDNSFTNVVYNSHLHFEQRVLFSLNWKNWNIFFPIKKILHLLPRSSLNKKDKNILWKKKSLWIFFGLRPIRLTGVNFSISERATKSRDREKLWVCYILRTSRSLRTANITSNRAAKCLKESGLIVSQSDVFLLGIIILCPLQFVLQHIQLNVGGIRNDTTKW